MRLIPLLVRLCLLSTLALGATAPVASAQSPAAAPAVTVIGTDTLHLRDCPATTCRVVGSASLGTELTITGEAVDGFRPVEWHGRTGWAYELFLAMGSDIDLVRAGVAGCDRVALIFNAGIGETPSETILETLIDSQAPATLFAMGWWAEEYPEYLTQLATEANVVVGTHGNTQTLLTDASDGEIAAEVSDSAAAIEAVLGYPPARYYTPYATDSDPRVQRVIAEQGYLPVGWTAAGADYTDSDTAEGVYDRVMADVEDGAIIELHLDGPSTDESTALALPTIIRDLEAQGYTLVTVPEILLPCPTGP